jgi:YEATS domain-containing protein 4
VQCEGDDKELNLLLSSLHLSDSQKQNKVKYKILIGNTHRQIENPKSENKHEWTVYVKGVNGSDLTDVIDKVTFELHHTFVPSLVTVNSAPFNVTRSGWGTFTIPVIIHFKNGTIFEAKHHLSFDTEDTSQMFEVDLQNHKHM